MVRNQLSAKKDFALGLAGLTTLITLWCLLTYGGFVKPLFLPSPTGVWEGMVSFANKGCETVAKNLQKSTKICKNIVNFSFKS